MIENRVPQSALTSICLVGPRSVGKSVTARLIAVDLNLPWVDTDTVVDRVLHQQSRTLDEVMLSHNFGMIHRILRSELRHCLQSKQPVVISAAGGTLWDVSCRRLISENCFVIGLLPSFNIEMSSEILFARDRRRSHFRNIDATTLDKRIRSELSILVPILKRISNVMILTENLTFDVVHHKVLAAVYSASK